MEATTTPEEASKTQSGTPPSFTFAVDWDGTCVEAVWPEMGEWLPGAVLGLKALDRLGNVVIHSARVAPFEYHPPGREIVWRDETVTANEVLAIKSMLAEIGLGHIEVWTRPYKPPALVYIDDRAIPFRGDWNRVLISTVRAIEAWEGEV